MYRGLLTEDQYNDIKQRSETQSQLVILFATDISTTHLKMVKKSKDYASYKSRYERRPAVSRLFLR